MAVPKYCMNCGKELVLEEIPQYNKYTGNTENSILILYCPERKPLDTDSSHTAYQYISGSHRFWMPLDNF